MPQPPVGVFLLASKGLKLKQFVARQLCLPSIETLDDRPSSLGMKHVT
jgi:hypothetical protein